MLPVKASLRLDLCRQFGGHPYPEPINVGARSSRGMVTTGDAVAIADVTDRLLLPELSALARRPDGSVRWALLDFVIAAGGQLRKRVRRQLFTIGCLCRLARMLVRPWVLRRIVAGGIW